MVSRLPALDRARIYFCPAFPSHGAKQSVATVRVTLKPPVSHSFVGVFLHDLPKTGVAAGAGAAAHPVPQKYP